jgi:hypothetical protein
MSENRPENQEDYPRENEVKRRGAQPGFQKFPPLPKKIPDQDVSGGIDSRPRKVVKEKDAPGHFRDACQQVGRDGRKQGDEPRDKDRLGAMTFGKALGPF